MRLRPDTAQARDSDVPHSVVTGSSVQDAVPPAPHPDDEHVMRIADVINNGQGRVLVLSGAGLSTESGIPDYRTSEMQRKVINPIKHHGVARHYVHDAPMLGVWGHVRRGTEWSLPWCRVCDRRVGAAAVLGEERTRVWPGLGACGVGCCHKHSQNA
jgi:hypothetical protein